MLRCSGKTSDLTIGRDTALRDGIYDLPDLMFDIFLRISHQSPPKLPYLPKKRTF
jgi:hypothetical protein|tara:strand:- start:21699 stop:21863 length:165 start_codon:yes stop_codon:yes gene_type:complete